MTSAEGWEKKDVDKWLAKVGPEIAWSFKTITFGYGGSGAPDYLICLNGCLWGLEIKRPGKSATVIQDKRMKAIRMAGGQAVAGTAEVVIAEMERWLAARGIVI